MAIPRRGFLKKGILGGALLVVGGGAGIALRSTKVGAPARAPLQLLTPAEHAVMAAIAARVVPGDGATGWPSAESLDCAGKVDRLLALAHPEVGGEFKQLLGLFENGLAGGFTRTGWSPFTRLAPAEQDARLEAWRTSRLALLRSGYQALVRLAHATYFSSPETYALVGYPGPPEVPR